MRHVEHKWSKNSLAYLLLERETIENGAEEICKNINPKIKKKGY